MKDLELMADVLAHWRRLYYLAKAKDLRGLLQEGYCSRSCAFCIEYYNRETYCTGCPIWVETGEHSCRGTPWKRVHFSILNLEQGMKHDPYWKKATSEIKDMGRWLKQLEDKMKWQVKETLS